MDRSDTVEVSPGGFGGDPFDAVAGGDEQDGGYAVCDRWFGSHPGPTQPNRFCTLSGHTPVLDNFPLGDPIHAYLRMPAIFEVLSEAGVDWAYFEGDVGFLRMYDRYRLEGHNVVGYDHPQNGFRRRAELACCRR